jgi:hypothetical protein
MEGGGHQQHQSWTGISNIPRRELSSQSLRPTLKLICSRLGLLRGSSRVKIAVRGCNRCRDAFKVIFRIKKRVRGVRKGAQWRLHYFEGIGETNLVLQPQGPKQRDGGFAGNARSQILTFIAKAAIWNSDFSKAPMGCNKKCLFRSKN